MTARGYGARWSRISSQVAREEPLCRRCLVDGRVTPGELTDHIRPKDEGGSDARENLQRLCRACHKRKTEEDKARAGVVTTGAIKSLGERPE